MRKATLIVQRDGGVWVLSNRETVLWLRGMRRRDEVHGMFRRDTSNGLELSVVRGAASAQAKITDHEFSCEQSGDAGTAIDEETFLAAIGSRFDSPIAVQSWR